MTLKIGIIILLLSSWIFVGVNWEDAKIEFEKKNYQKASYLFKNYALENPDYAGFLFHQAGLAELLRDSLKEAQWLFNQSLIIDNNVWKSSSYNYLGYINAKMKKDEDALNFWKLALNENPNNEHARYNYELCLRRKIINNLPKNPKNDEKNSSKKQKSRSNHSDKGDKTEMQSMGLEEVENILEAMENQEKKFIQQLRKRNKGSKLYDGSNW